MSEEVKDEGDWEQPIPIFTGLTKPATMFGLPIMFAVALFTIVGVLFIATGSLWTILAGVVVYWPLRLIARFNPFLFDGFLVTMREAPPVPSKSKKGTHNYVDQI